MQDFILMAMEVHDTPNIIWIVSLGSVLVFQIINDHEVIYSNVCIQFFNQHVSIALRCALAFVIDMKIALARDVCSRPSIIIKSHDLDADNIRGVVSEIASYHEKD
jgi:hypothetical protein